MKLKCSIIAVFVGGLCLAADDAVSPAFTFDARYSASGLTPDAWVAYQAEGLSGRFGAATVERAVDENANGIPDEWEGRYGLSGENAAADADPDGDGRTNLEEYNAGTNPVVAENYEASVSVSGAHVVDTWIRSTAVDGEELQEVWALSALFAADTAGRAPDADKDGIPDWWELLYGLDPKVADSQLDSDCDGRTNIEEYNAGTNPVMADDWSKSTVECDEAFVADTRVVYTGGIPSIDEAFAVVRVTNGFVCDTGGLYYDWDGDGIPNWWEARYSRDGGKTGLSAAADDDGDGYSNYQEFVAYTDPTNTSSRFVVGLARVEVVPTLLSASLAKFTSGKLLLGDSSGSSEFALQWQSVRGRIYSVYATDSLSKGWDTEPVAELEGTGDVLEYVPTISDSDGDAQFFRVSIRLSDE